MKYSWEPSWEEKQDVRRRAEAWIDSAWHYSWHWERDECGYLTARGWEQSLNDGKKLLAEKEQHVDKLKRVLADIEQIVAQCKRWAEEDKEDAGV